MFFAYDPGDALETLEHAAKRLFAAGFSPAHASCESTCSSATPKDTLARAEQRLRQILALGFTPMAMLWRPETPSQEKWRTNEHWRAFQRQWARPAIIHAPVVSNTVILMRKTLDADRRNR
jgi:hypothetical protein